MYGFEQLLQARSTYFVQHGSYVNIAAAIAVIIAFWAQWQRQQIALETTETFWFATGLYLLLFASFAWTDPPGVARKEWMDAVPYLVMFVGATPFLVKDAAGLRVTFGVTVVFGAIICFGLFFGTNWSARGIELAGAAVRRGGRMGALLGAPLSIAELGGTLAIIASLMNFDKVKFWKVAKWAIVILGLALAFRTQSRGQVLATFIVILMFQPVSGRAIGMKSIFLSIGLAIVMAAVFYLLLPIMDSNRWTHASRALDGRLSGVGVLYRDMVEKPSTWLVGNGAGSSWKLLNTYPHNVPVEVIYESGLLGFGLFSGFCVTIFKRIFDFTVDDDITPETRPVLATVFALFTFYLIISLKQGSVYSSISLLMLGVIADRLTTSSRGSYQRKQQERENERAEYDAGLYHPDLHR